MKPTTTTAPPTASGTSLTTFFPIGVWVPPSYDFAKWKSRGANTMFGVPDGNDPVAWSNAAVANGLKMIRQPSSSLSADTAYPNLIARAQPDEPDGIYTQTPYTEIQQQYRAMKAAMPNNPVLVNFVGDLNQYDKVTGESGPAWYQKYIQGADWVSADKYPVNSCQPITRVAQTVDTLRAWSGSKPVFIGLETTDYNLSDTCAGPTADQVRAEIWLSINHGVRGYYFFPEQISPSFKFDTTPTAVANELTVQNNRVTALTPVLQPYAVNPSTLSASLPTGLDAGWRDTPNGKYFFVVNTTTNTLTNQTMTFGGVGSTTTATVYDEGRSVSVASGRVTDTFGPHAVHIYKIG
ncbi:MAG: hypothetical protein ACOYNI_10505 [Acidimicrobiia bacterium]